MIISAIIGFLSLFFDVFYWAKWTASYLALKLHKRYVKRRFDLYDFSEGSNYEQLAVVPPKEEKILESPMPESHIAQGEDEVLFYGVNTKSECLVVRIARGCGQVAEAWIYLELADGRCFHLQDTSGFQRTYGDKVTAFSCGGLQAQYLSAMRRWRIHYCGMLRETTSKNEAEHRQVFVKFVFQWTASSDVFDPTSDLDVSDTAEAMTRVKWEMPFPPLKKIHDALNMYCQSGVITGTATVQNESKYELYLIGERIRFLGKVSHHVGSKFKYLLGTTPKNGMIVHVGKASIANAAENLYFGFIVHPDGEMRHLQVIDSRTNLSERNPNLNNWDITFEAGKHYHLTGRYRRYETVPFRAQQLWQGLFEAHFLEFELDGFKGRGLAMIGDVYGISTEKRVISIPQEIPRVVPMAVCFDDQISQLSEITGGKGSSLGKLTELSSHLKTFTVPKGIVVTTAAYYEFLTPEIHGKIAEMTDVVYGNVSGDVKKACKNVSDAVEKSILPNKIAEEIEQKLNILFDGKINNYKFAVRSSATGEDTDQMSAAGQMDTFLGVRGLKEIFTAVKKCWASQFGTIAIQYKRQNGQLLNSPMAVVIQQMVHCEAAGVLFTCDPVTSDPSVITITGNYGLGESVVSGSEEPDTIILDKSDTGVLNVRSVLVGSKKHKIVVQDSQEDGGTAVTDVPENERNQCCISNETALDLGNLSLKIEDFYKSPRDIEWGVKDGEIYILQSRPVTTGAETTDYEIMHEFDAPLRFEAEYFTKCNIGEVMPGATSPLGIDVLTQYFRISFRAKGLSDRQVNNFVQTIYYPSGIITFYNHYHMAVIDLLGRLGDLNSVMGQAFMIGIFGRILDEPELHEAIKYKEWQHEKKSILDHLKFYWNIFFCGRGIEKLQEQLNSYRFPEREKSPEKVFDFQMQHCDMLKESMVRHMVCTENSSFWNMQLFALLSKAKGRVDTDVYSDFAKLLSTMSNVESADVPNGMQRLSQYILKEKTSEEFKAMSVEDALEWLETSSSNAGFKYRQFIKRHGHRCLKEFDVHSKTWANDPKTLIKLLQNMSSSCENTKNKTEDSFSKTVSSLQTPVDLKTKWILRFMLPNCQRGVREREFCKSNLIKSVDNVRVGFQHLSKTMVAEGYVPDDNLIFFMTIDEIGELIKSRNPKIISRANHRRKLYPQLDTLRFEEISEGRPEPINMKNDSEEIKYDADLTMKGIPVSQGIIKGHARVALTLEEAADLKPGEILITYSTDIGWSPFFPILGGVVTELGGLISHGAVVSREYGLPCVVGLHNATRMFNTGDYVILDGNKGILQRIPHPES